MTTKTKPPVWARLLTFLLSLILFFSVSAAMFVGTIQTVTEKDNMSALIKQILFASHVVRPNIPAGNGDHAAPVVRIPDRLAAPTLRLDEEELPEALGTDALVEFLYDTVISEFGDQLGGEIDISLDEVKAFVEESTLKEEIADLSASMVSDILTGENTTQIDADLVVGVLQDNAELIEEYFDVQITEEILDAVTETINENEYIAQIQEQGVAHVIIGAMMGGGELMPGDPESDASGDIGTNNSGSSAVVPGMEMVQTLTAALDAFRAYTSTAALIACLAVCAVCVALIFVLNRKWIARALYHSGMPLVLSSLPMAALCGFVLFANDSFKALFSGSMAMVGTAGTLMVDLIAPIFLGVFGGGFALIVAAIVVKIVSSRKRETETAVVELTDALAEEEPILISTILDGEKPEQ